MDIDYRNLSHIRYADSGTPEVCGHTFYAGPLDERSVVVDLGGSLGFFSRALIAMKNCPCHVVEATADNYRQMPANGKMRKHHHAITGADGPVDFIIPEGQDYHWGMLASGGEGLAGKKQTVPGITLESFLKSQDIDRVDLLKVDIEGAEIAMFDTTSDRTLGAIGQISIEFHDFIDPKMAADIARIKARLAGLGFACIVFSRRFNGDVLFINRNLVKVSGWRLLFFAGPVKYLRGLRRMVGRLK